MSPGGEVRDAAYHYAEPARPDLNDWGLAGTWQVGAERATLAAPAGRIVYRFHARDLHPACSAPARTASRCAFA